MLSRTKHSGRTGVSRWMVATLLAAMGCLGVAAAPAVAGISDTDATPSHVFRVHGDGSGSDGASDVVIGSGVTWVAGSGVYAAAASDATLTRIQHSNWTASTQHWDGSSHAGDSASDIALAPDGGVYTTGCAGSNGTMSELLVIKWSKAGTVQWSRRYNGPADGFDEGSDVVVDRDGNVIVCGYSQGASRDWVVVSWTKAGKRRWAWRYDGSGKANDEARELIVDRDGCAYVCGTAALAAGVRAAAVAKLSPRGARMWMKTYPGPLSTGAEANAIVADPRGGVLVAGSAMAGPTGSDAMILRYSPSGARTTFPLVSAGGDAGQDVFSDVAVTTTRMVVGVGYRGLSGMDTLLARYGLSSGTLESWTVNATSGTIDRWLSVAADAYGGYVSGGMLGSEDTVACTRRESTLPGGAVWGERWAGPVAGMAVIGSVAAHGNIVAAVGMQNSGVLTGHDAVVLFWVY